MGSINILLIEDNPGDVELTREGLINFGKLNNQLDVVTDGEEALNYLYKRGVYFNINSPDIILLDLNLPKIDGREVLKAIKQDDTLGKIPVVVLSSSEAATDIQHAYNLHANCFITKPVQLDDFIKVIQMIEHFWIEIVRLPMKGD
ncbi:response regulator [Teredinibacter purpureus]|jgi:Response regulator containing a CheY-like receiver domain and an HTH DNA-binding domain|uniref:response regulator n=1 Tax=Teredinibacter purpureus TaxID=2731756 RepID=UPI0005F7BD70|nr:response regulator [Teredinibacter purpureus]